MPVLARVIVMFVLFVFAQIWGPPFANWLKPHSCSLRATLGPVKTVPPPEANGAENTRLIQMTMISTAPMTPDAIPAAASARNGFLAQTSPPTEGHRGEASRRCTARR